MKSDEPIALDNTEPLLFVILFAVIVSVAALTVLDGISKVLVNAPVLVSVTFPENGELATGALFLRVTYKV